MHLDILTYIILPNVGYWRGEKITSKQLLSHTKKILSMIKNIKSYDDYTEYYLDDELHRDNDLPAVEFKNGDKYWLKKEKLHRRGDLPAIEYSNGGKAWYKNGQRHRKGDLPATEYNYGTKQWWKNGKLHRKGDLPTVIYGNGLKQWYKNGKFIREE